MTDHTAKTLKVRRLLLLAAFASAAIPIQAASAGVSEPFAGPDLIARANLQDGVLLLLYWSRVEAVDVSDPTAPRPLWQWTGGATAGRRATPEAERGSCAVPSVIDSSIETRRLAQAERTAYFADPSELIILDLPGRAPPSRIG